ncbi:hypothetical protein PCAR4_1370004 [Paraburkholderia caribensis]|nr:hypothetical protein PCAR4_1370004 [Paraburkholderia caribensis]
MPKAPHIHYVDDSTKSGLRTRLQKMSTLFWFLPFDIDIFFTRDAKIILKDLIHYCETHWSDYLFIN